MDYNEQDKEFSQKIQREQNLAIVMAREVWLKEIKKGNYQASKDYLERKRRDEFSVKQEISQKSDITISGKDIKSMSDHDLECLISWNK